MSGGSSSHRQNGVVKKRDDSMLPLIPHTLVLNCISRSLSQIPFLWPIVPEVVGSTREANSEPKKQSLAPRDHRVRFTLTAARGTQHVRSLQARILENRERVRTCRKLARQLSPSQTNAEQG